MPMGKAYLPLYANISDDHEPLTVFILHHSAVGGELRVLGGENRIETGKNLNPVQKMGGRWNFGGKFPPQTPPPKILHRRAAAAGELSARRRDQLKFAV
jgi:hypothetical protein